MIQLFSASRTTSYSTSFQPLRPTERQRCPLFTKRRVSQRFRGHGMAGKGQRPVEMGDGEQQRIPHARTLLHKDLRRERQAPSAQLFQLNNMSLSRQHKTGIWAAAYLFSVVGKATTQTSEGICCADDDRIPNLLSCIQRFIDTFDSNRLCNRDLDFVKSSGEEVTVL